jgi:hypothetical protein
MSTSSPGHRRVVLQLPEVERALGRVVDGGLIPYHRVRLRALLSLDDVELDFVAFLQRLVSVHLDCGVMDKHVGPVIASNKSVALSVVEPLDLSSVLSHRLLPS